MARSIAAALAAVMLVLSQMAIANAAALRPSGKYAFTSADSCEAKFTFTFKSYVTSTNPTTTTDNAVRAINSVANGHIGSGIGYLTFTPTSLTGGNFSVSLTDVGGGALRINAGGTNVTTKPKSLAGSYSFTATTFTLTPTGQSAMVFAAAYGALNGTGAPSSVHLVRQDTGGGETGDPNNCIQSITASR